MDTTYHPTNLLTLAWPSYEQLLAENARLEQELRVTRRELQQTRSQLLQTRQQISELKQLVEKLQRQNKRQAAPFRKQEEPARLPKKSGRKRGRRHGRHTHRSQPTRIDEVYDAPLPECCPHCGGKHITKFGTF